ncbi:CD0519/CD1768 family membrane protein (plasmid) [Cetobacterium somerae]|uniref:CD0519/CD1768 family membrane protein n=1 Tax=Cetobacterium somerae TaxID=188913 RepID=UPI003D766EB9
MDTKKLRQKKAMGLEGFVCIGILTWLIYLASSKMGGINMINTIIKTAHDLLLNTVFFIMGVSVIAGAFAGILSEFGVIAILNKLLSPLMKPLYRLPGAAALGILTTYISDNPAILSLSADKGFTKYFKKYQLPALTNLGTSFGMGFIVSTFMIAQSGSMNENLVFPVILGNIGAFIGSVVSVNLMINFTKKIFHEKNEMQVDKSIDSNFFEYRDIRDGNVLERLLEALLEGGKNGVQMGMEIIPGVLIICTTVLLLTNGPGSQGYTGEAYQGIALLPYVGEKLQFILKPLFGFTSSKALAFPITSLGAVGAALGLIPQFISDGAITSREIAVFTAMGMTWSGYLSTHVAMMDSLGYRKLTGKAIMSHTIGGIVAGVAANILYTLFM